MSYWDSPIISSKYAYSIEIRTSIYSTGVFSVIATWDQYLFLATELEIGEKGEEERKKEEKKMKSQKNFVLMSSKSLFEV